MSDDPGQAFSAAPLLRARTRRLPVRVSAEALARVSSPGTEAMLPVVIEAGIDGVNLPGWAASNASLVEASLVRRGAVLFRGFSVDSVDAFEQFIQAISGDLLKYSNRSTPRKSVSGRIYTSTEYPADETISMHNEMSYARIWPGKIFFCCMQAPDSGGATPLADSRRVFSRISPAIREKFMRMGVMYVRNYGERLDLPWQEVFQTMSRAEVERYCNAEGMSFEWKPNGSLRTQHVCQAVVRHPRTGEAVWFNQAHLFHISGLDAQLREHLLDAFDPRDLPRNAYYGDGSPIEQAALDEIRTAYSEEQLSFAWRENDVLMLDNVLVAHGRAPFAGRRRIVVGMSESSTPECRG